DCWLVQLEKRPALVLRRESSFLQTLGQPCKRHRKARMYRVTQRVRRLASSRTALRISRRDLSPRIRCVGRELEKFPKQSRALPGLENRRTRPPCLWNRHRRYSCA